MRSSWPAVTGSSTMGSLSHGVASLLPGTVTNADALSPSASVIVYRNTRSRSPIGTRSCQPLDVETATAGRPPLASDAGTDRVRSARSPSAVSYTHLRAHETDSYLVCRLLL